ncbi:MAG: hypothetical protein INH41_28810 [Myxococcaceae bacterium]|nr:hypothetical protein [Myxococcaceae bacterium]
MKRSVVALVLVSGFVACQCGPGNPCEAVRCGPGLVCAPDTGRCVTGGTGAGGAVGGGLAGGGSAGGVSAAGGDAQDAGIDCPMTCGGATPVCDRAQGRCVACTAPQGCSGATPVCNRLWAGGQGRCQVCLDDNSGCSGATPYCDVTLQPAAGCIGCRSEADCATPGTTCDTFGTRTCVVDDGGFGGGSAGSVVFSDGGSPTRCLTTSTPGAPCTNECPNGFVCQGGQCVLRGSSGPLQVTLRFTLPEDLDLYVVEPLPDGGACEIFYGQRNVDAGPPPVPLPFPVPMPPRCGAQGWLDLDSNADCDIDNVNVENIIYSPGITPTSGTYVVRVNYFRDCTARGPVPYEVEVRANGQTRFYCGSFLPSQARRGALGAGVVVATFTIP